MPPPIGILSFPPQPTPHEPRVLKFRGGLRDAVSDEEIRDDELSLASNVIPDILGQGNVITREGISKYSFILAEAGTSIYEGVQGNYVTTTTKILSLLGTALKTGLTASTDPSWASMLNTDIYADGINAPQVTADALTFAALGGTPPTFKYLASHANFLFGAGHSKGLLRWADIGTTTAWTATNGLTITNQEGNDIVGIKKFNNVLIVFCRKSFHHVNGRSTVDMGITHNAYGIGCTSHRSIVVLPDRIAWWTDYGLAVSRSGFGDDIEYPFLKKIPSQLNGLNKTLYNLVHCVWNQKNERIECYVADGTSTTINKRLDYYYDEPSGSQRYEDIVQGPGVVGTCWPHTGVGVQMGASGAITLSGSKDVYLAGADSAVGPYVYKQDGTVPNDDGRAIQIAFESKRDAPLGIDAIKCTKHLILQMILGGAATVTYSIYVDNAISTTQSWTISLLSSAGFVLDVSQLDVGVLTESGSPYSAVVGHKRRYFKIKHRISSSSSVRTRFRAVINRGTLIAA